MMTRHTDIAIIGAGPAGSAAAAWLAQRGFSVTVIERHHFPRFSIGESLLPQCMIHLEACGLLDDAIAGDFQIKNGAAFTHRSAYAAIDFRDKFSPGPGETWQVERADFDHRLARGAERLGAHVAFGTRVESVEGDEHGHTLALVDETGNHQSLQARFILDASGYGRVLARLKNLARRPTLDSRCALFTHIEDHIDCPEYDREKILIGVHPDHHDIWYWLIPFRDGKSSLGIVGHRERLDTLGEDATHQLWQGVRAEPRFDRLLANATPLRDVSRIEGYSADVSRLHGPGFALLGNAGEFLDPVFSSGVTVALDSAMRAAPLVARQLAGECVDWHDAFEKPVRQGLATFRTFVESWYDGRLQQIIFSPQQPARVRAMISSVLAGYAWDNDNPYVSASERRLTRLAEVCESVSRQQTTHYSPETP